MSSTQTLFATIFALHSSEIQKAIENIPPTEEGLSTLLAYTEYHVNTFCVENEDSNILITSHDGTGEYIDDKIRNICLVLTRKFLVMTHAVTKKECNKKTMNYIHKISKLLAFEVSTYIE
jgi:hypothetical protein